MSVSDVFVSFFSEDYCAGFELDKQSKAWKEDMDAPKKRKRYYKNLSAKIKRDIRMVLMHADEFPLIPDDTSKYKEVLRRTASAAEERIRSSIGFGDKKTSVYTLTNLPETKDIENKSNLTANTPDDWQNSSKASLKQISQPTGNVL
jgi:hypothetical protein